MSMQWYYTKTKMSFLQWVQCGRERAHGEAQHTIKMSMKGLNKISCIARLAQMTANGVGCCFKPENDCRETRQTSNVERSHKHRAFDETAKNIVTRKCALHYKHTTRTCIYSAMCSTFSENFKHI